MKKIMIGFFLLVAIAGIVVLNKMGIISWQKLTIIFSAIAAPFKFIMGLFGSEKKIREEMQAERDAEHKWQKQLDERISQQEEKAAKLRKEIEELDTKKTELKKEKASIQSQVQSMSTEEKIQKGKDLIG